MESMPFVLGGAYHHHCGSPILGSHALHGKESKGRELLIDLLLIYPKDYGLLGISPCDSYTRFVQSGYMYM